MWNSGFCIETGRRTLYIFFFSFQQAPEVYLPFDEVQDSSTIPGSVTGQYLPSGDLPPEVMGVQNGALHLDGRHFVDYEDQMDDTCMRVPDLCPNGFTLSVWVRLLRENDDAALVVGGGGDSSSQGVVIWQVSICGVHRILKEMSTRITLSYDICYTLTARVLCIWIEDMA